MEDALTWAVSSGHVLTYSAARVSLPSALVEDSNTLLVIRHRRDYPCTGSGNVILWMLNNTGKAGSRVLHENS